MACACSAVVGCRTLIPLAHTGKHIVGCVVEDLWRLPKDTHPDSILKKEMGDVFIICREGSERILYGVSSLRVIVL